MSHPDTLFDRQMRKSTILAAKRRSRVVIDEIERNKPPW